MASPAMPVARVTCWGASSPRIIGGSSVRQRASVRSMAIPSSVTTSGGTVRAV